VPFISRSLMSSQRQRGNLKSSKEGSRSGRRKPEADGAFHSLTGGFFVVADLAKPQLSSETLRVVGTSTTTVMSSQRQGATRTVEERLWKRSGASCEANRVFHSLSCVFCAPPPLRRAYPAPLESIARRACGFDRFFDAERRMGARGQRHRLTRLGDR
jgi:hypothetical protein